MTVLTTAATAAETVVKDLAADMAAAAGAERGEPTPLAVAVAQARATLVHGLQRDAAGQGSDRMLAILSLTALLDQVLSYVADLEGDVPALSPAVSGATRALLLRRR